MMPTVTIREGADGSYLRADLAGPIREAWLYRPRDGVELHLLDGPRDLVRARIAGGVSWSFIDARGDRIAVEVIPRSP